MCVNTRGPQDPWLSPRLLTELGAPQPLARLASEGLAPGEPWLSEVSPLTLMVDPSPPGLQSGSAPYLLGDRRHIPSHWDDDASLAGLSGGCSGIM